VVEDEALVAFSLQQLLNEFGYEVVGPSPNTQTALLLFADTAIDAAVLDVNLGEERIDRVAEALAAASVPFVFATGYSDVAALPAAFKQRPMLNKPYQPHELQEAVSRLLG
jgi:CheY-like chemotaxis protein